MGVNVYYMKVYAFVISTFLAGLGGALFAAHEGYLNPSQFNFLTSINFVVIVVFGGLGSLTGTVLASFFLVILQEKLRFLQNYRMVIYPLLLIFMMIFRPQGLLGTKEFLLTDAFLSRDWWSKQFARFKAKPRRQGGEAQ
jgi:branched-chain amino acid transport system permease protein